MLIIETINRNGNPTRFGVFGTCRLTHLFDQITDSKRVKKLWQHEGFTHTIDGASQLINYLDGQLEIPECFHFLIFGKNYSENSDIHTTSIEQGKKVLESIDTLLIEVSSRSRIHVDNLEFDVNRFMEFFRPVGMPFLEWWSAITQGKEDLDQVISEFIIESSKAELLPKKELEYIANNCSRSISSETEIIELIWKLKEQTGKEIITVTNLDPTNINFSRFLGHMAINTEGFRHFDPYSVINNFDPRDVFLEEGKDLNHYKPSFHEVISSDLIDFIISEEQTQESVYSQERFLFAFSKTHNRIDFLDDCLRFSIPNMPSRPIDIRLIGKRQFGKEQKVMGWYNFSFITNSSFLNGNKYIKIKDSFSEQHSFMYSETSEGETRFSTVLWLDESVEFEFILSIPEWLFNGTDCELRHVSLDPLLTTKIGGLIRVNFPELDLQILDTGNDKGGLKINILDKGSETGGLIPINYNLLVDNGLVNFNIDVKTNCCENCTVVLRLWNGLEWVDIGKVSNEFEKFEFNEYIYISEGSIPRVGFTNHCPKASLIIRNFELRQTQEISLIHDSLLTIFGPTNSRIVQTAFNESGISIIESFISYSEDNSMDNIIENLFLQSKSCFCARVFLNLQELKSNDKTKSIEAAITGKWGGNESILNHWRLLLPWSESAWKRHSTYFWNNENKQRSVEIAELGLYHFPDSQHLLQIKAHGLRMKKCFSEALDIYLALLDIDNLEINRFSTLYVACQCLIELENWKKSIYYIKIALELRPEHQELKKIEKIVNLKLKYPHSHQE